MKEHSRYNSCPNCGLSNNPKVENDGYDTCITCIVCNYFTGYHYMLESSVIWNTTGLNELYMGIK